MFRAEDTSESTTTFQGSGYNEYTLKYFYNTVTGEVIEEEIKVGATGTHTVTHTHLIEIPFRIEVHPAILNGAETVYKEELMQLSELTYSDT